MNDGLELSHASGFLWDKIFFASFMIEPKESIAMWSMYAQPWEKGVMIKIPVEQFKAWVNSILLISSADSSTKKAHGDDISYSTNLFFHAVAYTNADSVDAGEPEIITCGGEENRVLSKATNVAELVGFIKDSAWSYENEFRLRVEVTSDHVYDAVSIQIPDAVIDTMEIVAGPRFAGNLSERIGQEIQRQLKFDQSLFSDKLKWIPCDTCSEKCKGDNCSKHKITD